MDALKKYWSGLQARERLILVCGGVVVALILFYALVWQPWHKAISEMEAKLPTMRSNLVWMRQQADTLANSGGGADKTYAGADQSLLSVVEQSAGRANVKSAIQQLVPSQNGSEVRVVLDGVNFNQWIRWIDDLFKRYGVNIKQATAERNEDSPNIAEVRVTFVR